MRVLHVLANGPPDVNGYAVRTHSLLTAQLDSGVVSPVALTSPWYPERESMFTPYEANGVTYHRTLHPAHIDKTSGVGMGWSATRGKA